MSLLENDPVPPYPTPCPPSMTLTLLLPLPPAGWFWLPQLAVGSWGMVEGVLQARETKGGGIS